MSENYTVRMGIIDTRLWSQHDLVALYKTELSKLGFKTNQLPNVMYPETKIRMENGNPFPEARTIHIDIPVFGKFDQTRDMRLAADKDPAKLAKVGKAVATIFTWNLCAPETDKDPAGSLRNIFRSVKPDAGVLKLSPKVDKFLNAPLDLAGYPQKQGDPNCKVEKPTEFKSKSGWWTLLFGLGVSLLTKGKA